jgi:hypothetical protein
LSYSELGACVCVELLWAWCMCMCWATLSLVHVYMLSYSELGACVCVELLWAWCMCMCWATLCCVHVYVLSCSELGAFAFACEHYLPHISHIFPFYPPKMRCYVKQNTWHVLYSISNLMNFSFRKNV